MQIKILVKNFIKKTKKKTLSFLQLQLKMPSSRITNSSQLAKSIVWSADDLKYKEFMKNDYPNKERIDLKEINQISDGNLVFEV